MNLKALRSTKPGGPDNLVIMESAPPEPGASEVLVRVMAVGLNYPDLLIIEDLYQYKPERPFSPGAEIAGVIEHIGKDVSGFKVGDRVMAVPGWGGLAEQVVVPAHKVSAIPKEMPFTDAAAFLMTYGTSYNALYDRAKLKKGETLLVLGASGGVGLAAVELGVAMGARVIAAASTQEKLQTAIDAGASDGIVYPSGELDRDAQKELSSAFKQVCGKEGPNVIYDPVGGAYSEPALRSIAWEGRYLVVGFPAGIAKLPLNLPLLKACSVIGVFWGAAVEHDPKRHAQAVNELFDFYKSGKIHPLVETVSGLEQASNALKKLASRTVKGKLVVQIVQ
jgi:NADPH2:quinone reductase